MPAAGLQFLPPPEKLFEETATNGEAPFDIVRVGQGPGAASEPVRGPVDFHSNFNILSRNRFGTCAGRMQQCVHDFTVIPLAASFFKSCLDSRPCLLCVEDER